VGVTLKLIIDRIILHRSFHGKWKVAEQVTFEHILFIVVKGRFRYHIAGHSFTIKEGEGLFIPEGTLRAGEADTKEGCILISAHFRNIAPEKIAPLLDEPYKLIRFIGFQYVHQRFSLLNECWLGRLPGYELISEGILLELLGIVQRELEGGGHAPARRNLALRIQQYIVQHHREPLHLSDLARHVDRSPAYVSTVFKEIIGRTPFEYLHEVRVSAARELILTTNMTIREIAEALGYCDQSYFHFMYKKIVGHAPSHTLKIQK
jgi:AraC-like DNA-binding protein